MCSGGSKAATITMPDTSAYDRQFDLQKEAIMQQMNSGMDKAQFQLQSSLKRNEQLMEKLVQLEEDEANDPGSIASMVDERIATMMSISESLVPDKGAAGVQVGASRKSDVEGALGGAKTKGKAGLRIRRRTKAPTSGDGVGLSISSGG